MTAEDLAQLEQDFRLIAREPPGSKHEYTGDPAGGDHRSGKYAGKYPCWCVARIDAIERVMAWFEAQRLEDDDSAGRDGDIRFE